MSSAGLALPYGRLDGRPALRNPETLADSGESVRYASMHHIVVAVHYDGGC